MENGRKPAEAEAVDGSECQRDAEEARGRRKARGAHDCAVEMDNIPFIY